LTEGGEEKICEARPEIKESTLFENPVWPENNSGGGETVGWGSRQSPEYSKTRLRTPANFIKVGIVWGFK